MPQVTVDLSFEKIVATVKELSQEEQEQLFFAVNNEYAHALKKMKDDAWQEHQEGKSIPLEDLE